MFFRIYSLLTHLLCGASSNLLVQNTSFTNFSLDLAKEYYIFSFRNSNFKIKECIFIDFNLYRSESAQCFILFTETLGQTYFEVIKFINTKLNLVKALYENRMIFRNLIIYFHSDNFVIGSISQFRSSFIFFQNCTFYLIEDASFQIEKSNTLIFKNNKVIQFFRHPSIFLWSDIINCTIIIKNSFFYGVTDFVFLKQDNNIQIKDCEFFFKTKENFLNQIIKAFFSNKIFLENLRIIFSFAQSNIDLLLFQIENFIKIKNIYILSPNKKMDESSASMSRIIFLTLKNFLFLAYNQTIRAGDIFCFLDTQRANLILIKHAFFNGELFFPQNFLKFQKSSVILKNVHINRFKGLFFNFFEGKLILNTVYFEEGDCMFANLTNVTCLMVNLKISSKKKIHQDFIKFNISKIYFYKIFVNMIIIKKGFLFTFIDSNAFIKDFFASKSEVINEQSGLFRMSGKNSRILFKLCVFNINIGSYISPLLFLISFELSSLYILHCKFSFNSAPNGNIIYLSHSKKYTVLFSKNTFYSNTFKKNGLPIMSKGALFFSYLSEGIFNNIQNRFNKNKADFGEFIYIQETTYWSFFDEKNFKIIDTKNLAEKEFSIFFFDNYLEDLKTYKLESVIYDKKYEACLLKIKLIASNYGEILNPYLNFIEVFNISSIFEAERELFLPHFLNLGGYYCLKGEFSKRSSFLPSPQEFKIILKKSKKSQAIHFTASFMVKCDFPKFLDYLGVCSSCPVQTYPSFLIKRLSSNDYGKRCLTCDSTNNIGLFCFGDDIYTPRVNYWQPKYGSFLYFRCPFDGNCRGDEKGFKESSEMIPDEKYATKFCERDFKGLLCLSCKKGYGRWLEHKCESCFSKKNTIFLMFQIFIKLLVCLYILSLSLKINWFSSLNMTQTQYLKKLKSYYIIYMITNMQVQMVDSILSLNYEAFPYFNVLLDITMMLSTQLKFFIPFQCLGFFGNNRFFAKFAIFVLFYIVLTLLFLVTIFKSSIFHIYVKSQFDKMKYVSSAVFISIYSVYFLFSSTLIELGIKIFFCIDIETEENTIINSFLFDIDIDCAGKEFAKIYMVGILILSILITSSCSILIIKLISKNTYLVTYIFCHYKPKYFLTGIHYLFPQFVLIFLINYIKYIKVINGDFSLLLAFLGIWILLFLFRKSIISVYSLTEIKLKHWEFVLWLYLIIFLFMISLKTAFAGYSHMFFLDIFNLILVVLIIFSNKIFCKNFKQILKTLSSFCLKFLSKMKVFQKKKEYRSFFNLNHNQFFHKYILMDYYKKIGEKDKSNKEKSKKIISFLISFFRFKGRLNLENKKLFFLFKLNIQSNSEKKITLNEKQKIYLQNLFHGRTKFVLKIIKKTVFNNFFLSISFKSMSNIKINDFFAIFVKEKKESARYSLVYHGKDMKNFHFQLKPKKIDFSMIFFVRYEPLRDERFFFNQTTKRKYLYEAIFFISIYKEKNEEKK